MQDLFHEAKEALELAKREYTSVGSLSTIAAYSTNQACENSVRAIWKFATGNQFPHKDFKPFHKPTNYIKQIGLYSCYSNKTQNFLEKLTGYALDDARYDNTQAYITHTNPKNKNRGQELIEGTSRFINETEHLMGNTKAVEAIRNYERKLIAK